ncbi:15935_t:CDS:2 [Entrophospora sp. SA101]|nr:6130_t:CDS:2 [Entrophospora sp. SA101]CAJ0756555.1 15935_t:CDS:2 [Entrophospora sp. SA101]CAJ0842795.1 3068_t:CDS:2 [Entrophospora sp. SA101]CAJ0893384.1 8761_t:CDS:2 [Entrophospora sp. SA101]
MSKLEVIEPSDSELKDIALALQKIWALDYNRLKPEIDYVVNLPIVERKGDNTPEKLFQFVTDRAKKIPTYNLFYLLLDNYIPETGIPEKVDVLELKENEQFIKACMQTAPMIYVYKYLKALGVFPGDRLSFEKKINHLWFDLYTREGGAKDSSAFEHVFVGEIRNNEAKGFHNWITLYFYERSGKIDYEGFVPLKNSNKRLHKPDPTSHLITIRFNYQGKHKPFSSTFVGTSPEFEMAVYTLLFFLKREDTHVTLDDTDINFKIYPFYQVGGGGARLLGSAFPIILRNNNE